MLLRRFGRDLQEHLFERAAAGLQRGEGDVLVAQEAREVGDAGRRARDVDDVLPRSFLDDTVVGETERRRERAPVEAGYRREPDLVGGRRVLGQLGRASRARRACRR